MSGPDFPDEPPSWFDRRLDEDFARGAEIHEPDAEVRTQRAERERRTAELARRLAAGVPHDDVNYRLAPLSPDDIDDRTAPATTPGPRPPIRASLRWALAATAVAAVAIVLVMQSRGPGTSSSEIAAPNTTLDAAGPAPSTTITLAKRSFAVGECVTWNQELTAGTADDIGFAPGRDTPRVPCTQPHLLQVAGTITAPEQDTSLSPPDFDAVIESECRPLASQLIGAPLDPAGRFTVGALVPTPDGWANGDRQIVCGVELARRPTAANDPTDGSTEPLAFSVDARRADQTFVLPPGTCGLDGQLVTCDQPHTWETTGSYTLPPTIVPSPSAGPAEWSVIAGVPCLAMAEQRLGGPIPPDLTTSQFPIAPESYAAGNRTVTCALVGIDGTPVTGAAS